MWHRIFALLLLATLTTIGCYGPPPTLDLAGSFQVTFDEDPKGGLGTPDKPRPVSEISESLYLNVQALDKDGKPDTAYNGNICIYASRGIIDSSTFLTPIKDGVGKRIRVRLRLAFGRTSIWISEAKDMQSCPASSNPDDTTRPTTGRSGSAPFLYFEELSIPEVQRAENTPYNSPLLNKYAVIGRGKMVVTAVTSNGFFITDMDAYQRDLLSFHSLFIFTFSAPTLAFEEGSAPKLLEVGNVIRRVEGGLDEFSGQTQLTFPSFEPVWNDPKNPEKGVFSININDPKQFPAPMEVNSDVIWRRASMEPYEAAIVEVKNAIPIPFPVNQDGWQQFRQWPVLFVEAPDEQKRQECLNFVKDELRVHADPAKNKGGIYQPCLAACRKAREAKEATCTQSDAKAKEACLEQGRDAWFDCYLTGCRFGRPDGLFSRIEAKGCKHGIIMVISASTVPTYDPLSPEHTKNEFTLIRGVLQEVRASGFYELREDHFPDELTNNGYVIWVRGPEDLQLKSK